MPEGGGRKWHSKVQQEILQQSQSCMLVAGGQLRGVVQKDSLDSCSKGGWRVSHGFHALQPTSDISKNLAKVAHAQL